ncbi:MAG: aminotransferase class V-fold PLP-dependent enzyme [Synechococcus sp. SB0676_bin_10]|uniref:Aminotransferase class V-fold PLP-dependent enzyme n=1 Tax=Synechococcus sp. SB0676_bin_10 TaxID=2604869 RepID=A0A6B1F5Y9_9SYNE|nr:aminotransferase class V-fold PLP-dependent enzyme [Synechococcus sp. SB0676_bin_10]
MPALANKTYFNYGGQGPLPTASLQAMAASWRRIQELGPFAEPASGYVEELITSLRQTLAALCGVPPQRLAFTENVTSGCVLPLWGLPWHSGDQLLISDGEHPGVVATCHEIARREELDVGTLPVQDCVREDQVLERLDKVLQPRTRLVVLSHLLWNTGAAMPIPAVGQRLREHANQPWLLVDGAQSAGVAPLADAVAAADLYACTGHKWCCGPEGLGAMAVSQRLLDGGAPTMIGWRGLAGNPEHPLCLYGDARRYEIATSCYPLMAGLLQSLRSLAAVGDSRQRLALIQAHSGHLWRGLRQLEGVETLLPEPPPAGLVSFRVQGHRPRQVVHALAEQGLVLRSFEKPDCVRACCHVTTLPTELGRLIFEIASFVTNFRSA